ncbi:MAG: nucleotide-diphospho-sugar transferase, partial [Flavobacteriaceae bacterium]|nr:nucleotide-diphospho-sugar transferase [Flavobacteriaceae bacterium]
MAADGPRKNKPGEIELCQQTRNVIKQIDWDCELKTLFREENLGCGKAISSAITWFFTYVEQGIILEDDCLPHPDFFPYCHELLEKYKDNDHIMSISGNNFQGGIERGNTSFYFSAF